MDKIKNISLNLIRIWFNMILSGYKREEYREIKPYFCSKFLLAKGEHKKLSWWKDYFNFHSEVDIVDMIEHSLIQEIFTFKHYSTVTFSNGMTPPVPRFRIRLRAITISKGLEVWGAEPSVKYFVLSLGRIIE